MKIEKYYDKFVVSKYSFINFGRVYASKQDRERYWWSISYIDSYCTVDTLEEAIILFDRYSTKALEEIPKGEVETTRKLMNQGTK